MVQWAKEKQPRGNCLCYHAQPFSCNLILSSHRIQPHKIIGNGKRLIAYEIIDRLKKHKEDNLPELYAAAVTERDKNKGQLHRVLEVSFDAKPAYNQKFFMQKFNYIIIILLVVNGNWWTIIQPTSTAALLSINLVLSELINNLILEYYRASYVAARGRQQ
jgi:hypothetical protein